MEKDGPGNKSKTSGSKAYLLRKGRQSKEKGKGNERKRKWEKEMETKGNGKKMKIGR